MHYFQFNIGDYRAATAHLSNEEDLAYRRLLDMYYDTEQKIPLDTQWVARRLRVGTQVVEAVLSDMFEKQEDGWFHARCEEVIKQYKEFAEAGKRGAAKRWGNKGVTPLNGEASSPPTPPPIATINQELITTNDIKVAKATPDLGKPKSVPPAPIQEIVEMYNTILPELPQTVVVNDSRKRAIAARWREVVTADKLDRQGGLDFFRWYFEMVKTSKFLTGKSKDWKADMDFLFNPSKFPRVIEGTYHKEQK
jgi:uncharacterized protein YdaU (DUF1376 family)